VQTYRPSAEDRTAFTLVELTVVLMLVAILSAMIIPAMKGTYQDALLRSTSRELINSFGIAYSRAVSLDQLHRVRIDATTGKYLVEHHQPGESPDEFAPVRDVPGCQGKLDTRISVRIHERSEMPDAGATTSEPVTADFSGETIGPDRAISFYPDGTADGVDLELLDQEGFRIGLRINPTTARVEVVELKRQ
jgi:prepilin-type N-terminal cleavage/methylation domain-containing protein